jgi:hypothetical protein
MTETKWSRFDFVPVSCKRGLKSRTHEHLYFVESTTIIHIRRPANLNKSVSKMPSMAFFVTSWQLAFSYSLDTGEQRLIGCHL